MLHSEAYGQSWLVVRSLAAYRNYKTSSSRGLEELVSGSIMARMSSSVLNSPVECRLNHEWMKLMYISA